MLDSPERGENVNLKEEGKLGEVEMKKLNVLQEKLLGTGTRVTAEYRTVLLESIKCIIPRFERTRVVSLRHLFASRKKRLGEWPQSQAD